MHYNFPHTIKSHLGEELIFHRIEMEGDEEKLIVENFVAPNAGPIMHTHYKQDEGLTVLHGKLGYQIQGEEPKYAKVGETIVFKRGIAHRFWNAGEDDLNCFGWIKPANNVVFFLTALYNSINETGTERPNQFDGAFLMHKYRTEFDMPEVPKFVKSVIIPATYGIGKLTGRYKKYKDAPEAVK